MPPISIEAITEEILKPDSEQKTISELDLENCHSLSFLDLHDKLQEEINRLRQKACRVVNIKGEIFRVYNSKAPVIPPAEEPHVIALQYLQGALLIAEYNNSYTLRTKLIDAYKFLKSSLNGDYQNQIELVDKFRYQDSTKILNVSETDIGIAKDYALHLSPEINVCTIIKDDKTNSIQTKLTRPIKQSEDVIQKKLFNPLDLKPLWLSKDVIGENNWLRKFLSNGEIQARIKACGTSPPPSLRSSPLRSNAKIEESLIGSMEKKDGSLKVNVQKKNKWRRYGTPSAFLIPLSASGKETRAQIAETMIREDLNERLGEAIEDYMNKYGSLEKNGPIQINILFQRLLSPLTPLDTLFSEGYTEDDNMLFLREEYAAIVKIQEELQPIKIKYNNEDIWINPALKQINTSINDDSWLSKTRKCDIDDSEDLMQSVAVLVSKAKMKSPELNKFISYIQEPNWSWLSSVALPPPDINTIIDNLDTLFPELDQPTRCELALKMKAAIQLKKINHVSALGKIRRFIDDNTDFLGIFKLPFHILNVGIDVVDRGIIGAFFGSFRDKQDAWSKFKDYFISPENYNLNKSVAESICSDSSSNGCKSARDRTTVFGIALSSTLKNGFETEPNLEKMKAEFQDGHFIHALGDKTANIIKLNDVREQFTNFVSEQQKRDMKSIEIFSKNKCPNDRTNPTLFKLNLKSIAKTLIKTLVVGSFIAGCVFTGGMLAAGSVSVAAGIAALAALGGSYSASGFTAAAAACIFGPHLIQKISIKIADTSSFLKRNPRVKYGLIIIGVIAFMGASVLSGGILPAVVGGTSFVAAVTTAVTGIVAIGWPAIAIPGVALLMGVGASLESFFNDKKTNKIHSDLSKMQGELVIPKITINSPSVDVRGGSTATLGFPPATADPTIAPTPTRSPPPNYDPLSYGNNPESKINFNPL